MHPQRHVQREPVAHGQLIVSHHSHSKHTSNDSRGCNDELDSGSCSELFFIGSASQHAVPGHESRDEAVDEEDMGSRSPNERKTHGAVCVCVHWSCMHAGSVLFVAVVAPLVPRIE